MEMMEKKAPFRGQQQEQEQQPGGYRGSASRENVQLTVGQTIRE